MKVCLAHFIWHRHEIYTNLQGRTKKKNMRNQFFKKNIRKKESDSGIKLFTYGIKSFRIGHGLFASFFFYISFFSDKISVSASPKQEFINWSSVSA